MTAKVLQTASRMLEVRDTMKRLKGGDWNDAAERYRAVLRGLMRESRQTNPLAVALPIAQDMDAKGHSPLMLLAVATDMAEGVSE